MPPKMWILSWFPHPLIVLILFSFFCGTWKIGWRMLTEWNNDKFFKFFKFFGWTFPLMGCFAHLTQPTVSGSRICLSLSFTSSGFGKSEMQIIQNRRPYVVIMFMKGRFFVLFPTLFVLEKADSAPLCLIKAITAHCVI